MFWFLLRNVLITQNTGQVRFWLLCENYGSRVMPLFLELKAFCSIILLLVRRERIAKIEIPEDQRMIFHHWNSEKENIPKDHRIHLICKVIYSSSFFLYCRQKNDKLWKTYILYISNHIPNYIIKFTKITKKEWFT